MAPELPLSSRVVVVGGGIIGTSVAYHLARLGWTDVVLVEQGRLSCGTTWHASGLLGQLRATEGGTRLVQYSASLYRSLEAETGLATGYKACGGLTVARTPERMTQLRRTAATAAAFGLECELISPARAGEMYPLMETKDVLGAIWLPGDATVNAGDVTASLARGARQLGVTILERTRVIGFTTLNGAVTGVKTDAGHIATETVVNCAGQWAKAVGGLCGVNVPLHSAEHFYVVTDQIDGMARDLPILRDPDGYTYFREEVGGLLVGGFEPTAKPWLAPDRLPVPFEFQLLDEDWDHFSILMENAILRLPALATTGIRKFYNGPESFTPDNQFLLGEAPELKRFFVAAGFNSVGIATAGGAGRAVAEWIVGGEPTSDLSEVDIRRFAPFTGNNQWLHDRVGEVLGLHYAIPWPNRELETARPGRRSPAYSLLAGAGACFGSAMGWERANFFAPPGTDPAIEYGWGKQNWLPWSATEQLATRRDVAVYDQSSFGKLLVTGSDAEALLQWLCTADVAVAPGRAVYTGMLNSRGGYESDLTVTRLGSDEFLLVTASGSVRRDLDWITRRTRSARVSTVDVTSAYAVYGVMGPRSRLLLQQLSQSDLSNEAFPFATSRMIDVGPFTVRATRITYVGELGWELYVPVEFAVGVYELLMSAGEHMGLVNGGYYALNSLRLEKGYRAWGRDIGPDDTPVEAGLLFACKLGTDIDFHGRAAVERVRAEGPQRRLVSLVVHDGAAMLWGGELVRSRGQAVGRVTSGAWGETLGSCVGLAYLSHHDDRPPVPAGREVGGPDGSSYEDHGYEVDIAGERYPVSVHRKAPHDPSNAHVHA